MYKTKYFIKIVRLSGAKILTASSPIIAQDLKERGFTEISEDDYIAVLEIIKKLIS